MHCETEPIIIKTFGGFSIRRGDCIIAASDNRSKKIWKLLEYIVHHRSRRISQQELLELLWPGKDGNDPRLVSSLKTLLCRVRDTLDQLEFADSRRMILRKEGSCFWNPDLAVQIDADDFGALIAQVKSTDDPEEKLNLTLRVMSLYKGRYLGGSGGEEAWVKQSADRYETMYLYCYNAAIQILAGEERYDQILSLSRHAIEMCPRQEICYYNEICALIEKGENGQALAAYHRVMDYFYQVYRKTPSDNLRKLYRSIERADNGIEPDLAVVREKMNVGRARSVRCEYDTFRLLYLQYCNFAASRKGKRCYLILLTVATAQNDGSVPPPRQLDPALALLETNLQEVLSKGDLYTRYSLTQFLALATFQSEEELSRCRSRLLRGVSDNEIQVTFLAERV